MSKHDEEFFGVVDKMIEEKTFSLEAVEAIKTMREKLEAALGDIKRSEQSCDNYKEQLKVSEEFGTITDKALKAYQEIEIGLDLREKRLIRVELNAEAEKRVGDAYRDCFYAITKNTIIRESVQREVVTPVEGTPAGEYTSPIAGHGQKDTVTENKETAKE